MLVATAATLPCACVSITLAPPLPDVRDFYDDHAEVDRAPALKASCGEIEVPRPARDAGQEGWVVTGLDVGADGHVTDVVVHASSDPMFEAVARSCGMATTYYPAEHEGEAVAFGNMPQVIHFKLDEAGLFGMNF